MFLKNNLALEVVMSGPVGLELISVSVLLPCNRMFCIGTFVGHPLLHLLFSIPYLMYFVLLIALYFQIFFSLAILMLTSYLVLLFVTICLT